MTGSPENAITSRRGPSTAAGKAASSRNSLRHGLQAASLVIPGVESEEDWAEFSHGVDASLAPRGAVEAALAARVAELLWRIRRIPRAEHDMITAAQERQVIIATREAAARDASGDAEAPASTSFYAAALTPLPPRPRLMPHDGGLQQIIRYEAHLNRQLYHALHELEALQARRAGNASPLARIDVHGAREEERNVLNELSATVSTLYGTREEDRTALDEFPGTTSTFRGVLDEE